jgi:hypothetical protein
MVLRDEEDAMSWAPQPPGSWPYFELVTQRVDDLRAAAERDHLAREARAGRSRARRWLGQPIAVAARVNDVLGWIISPSRPSLRH